MSAYWNPENRHKYEKIDYTRKPGQPKIWVQRTGLILSSILLAPVFVAFLIGMWYMAIPLCIFALGYVAYKSLSE
jgi:hypothetical protein